MIHLAPRATREYGFLETAFRAAVVALAVPRSLDHFAFGIQIGFFLQERVRPATDNKSRITILLLR